jgi:hypothetical protein
MRKGYALGVLVVTVSAAAGCRGMSAWQEAEYKTIESAGLPLMEPKEPIAAAALNLLPGIGDAYNGEWGAFVANFLLWPASVLWGVPEAMVTAHNINKQDTWAYYTHGPGKAQFEAAKAKQDQGGARPEPASAPASATAPAPASRPAESGPAR